MTRIGTSPAWRKQRREKKRDKARRTADTPEKVAERGKRKEAGPGENADRAGLGLFLGGGGM
jgi:hypothetical protein